MKKKNGAYCLLAIIGEKRQNVVEYLNRSVLYTFPQRIQEPFAGIIKVANYREP